MSNITTMIYSTKHPFSTNSIAMTTDTNAVTTQSIAAPPTLNTLSRIQLMLLILIALIGAVGNILVLLVLTSRKHRSKTSTILVMNLAVCDTLVTLVCIPLDTVSLALQRWVFGNALCRVIYPFQTSLPIVSSYTLLFMMLERNMLFSNRILSILRSSTIKGLVSVTWLLPFLVVLPYAVNLHVTGSGLSASCSERWNEKSIYRKAYTVALSLIEYLIPMLVIVLFVWNIVGHLCHEQRLAKRGTLGLGRRTSMRRIRMQRRLSIIFIVMVVTYAVLKLPNNIFWQLVEFGDGIVNDHFAVVHVFVGLCAYSTCATNPFILLSMSSEFRKDIRKMFLMCKVFQSHDLSKPVRGDESKSDKSAMLTLLDARSSVKCDHFKLKRLASRQDKKLSNISIPCVGESKMAAEKKLSVRFKNREVMRCNRKDLYVERNDAKNESMGLMRRRSLPDFLSGPPCDGDEKMAQKSIQDMYTRIPF
eukprot:Seg1221.13 transcript_id=Seg1221.13/GoldUCD/mRNA.D3Y31 product="Neuropeptide Y receptor type 4" protein_id=Seg1221.13/GoldUCD/D3Y31